MIPRRRPILRRPSSSRPSSAAVMGAFGFRGVHARGPGPRKTSALFVTLSAESNPDFDPGSHSGSVSIRPQKVRVADLADASRIAQEFIQEHDLGGGNWTGGLITDASGKAVGRVSYNGRVWSLDGVLLLEAAPLRGHR